MDWLSFLIGMIVGVVAGLHFAAGLCQAAKDDEKGE